MRRHPGTFVAGLLFVIVGVVYLLEAFEVWVVDITRLWPMALIGIGLVMILGRGQSTQSTPTPETPPPPPETPQA